MIKIEVTVRPSRSEAVKAPYRLGYLAADVSLGFARSPPSL